MGMWNKRFLTASGTNLKLYNDDVYVHGGAVKHELTICSLVLPEPSGDRCFFSCLDKDEERLELAVDDSVQFIKWRDYLQEQLEKDNQNPNKDAPLVIKGVP